MSIFSGLFRSRDKPADGYRPQNKVGNAFSFLFGGTTSGKAVNERTAMQTTAVYACVRIATAKLGNGSRYPEIKSLNGLTSDTITTGQKLKIPKK